MKDTPRDLPEKLYSELHALAQAHLRGERKAHTLQPTALVNEAYLRLADYGDSVWTSPRRFRAIAAACIRHILVQHARRRGARKRGGDQNRLSLVDLSEEPSTTLQFDVLELESVLEELELHDPQSSQLVTLRYFGGLTVPECSEELDLSVSTVKSKCRFGLAWLRMRLEVHD